MKSDRDIILEGRFGTICGGNVSASHAIGGRLSIGQCVAHKHIENLATWQRCYPSLRWWPEASCCTEHNPFTELTDRVYPVKL